tara:strand:+ start:125 stop:865 length:741 start_codon:yes stop_codon:yes gene_type:complete
MITTLHSAAPCSTGLAAIYNPANYGHNTEGNMPTTTNTTATPTINPAWEATREAMAPAIAMGMGVAMASAMIREGHVDQAIYVYGEDLAAEAGAAIVAAAEAADADLAVARAAGAAEVRASKARRSLASATDPRKPIMADLITAGWQAQCDHYDVLAYNNNAAGVPCLDTPDNVWPCDLYGWLAVIKHHGEVGSGTVVKTSGGTERDLSGLAKASWATTIKVPAHGGKVRCTINVQVDHGSRTTSA